MPEEYQCPISCELMMDPVFADDGETYERVCLQEWFATGGRTSPATNAPLASLTIRPNHFARKMIDAFLDDCRASGVEPADA